MADESSANKCASVRKSGLLTCIGPSTEPLIMEAKKDGPSSLAIKDDGAERIVPKYISLDAIWKRRGCAAVRIEA